MALGGLDARVAKGASGDLPRLRCLPRGRVLFLALLLLSCTFDGASHALGAGVSGPALIPASTPTSESTSSTGTCAHGEPDVDILAPTNGTIVTGGEALTISFNVSSFTLTAPEGQPNAAGTGYLNVLVDGVLDEAVWAETPLSLALPDGPQSVELQLVNNDGTPYFPSCPGFLSVEMTHGPNTGAPQVFIWAPARGQSFSTTEVTLSFYIADFTIVQPVGQSNAPNEGHIHAYLDGVYFAMITVEQAFILTGLTPGQHSLELILVNNDHTAYLYGGSTTPITAWTVFNVTAPPTVSTATSDQAASLEDLSLGCLALSVLVLVAVVVLRPRAPPRVEPGTTLRTSPSVAPASPAATTPEDRE